MKKAIAILMVLVCIAAFAACNIPGAIVYDLENTDRANYFSKFYNKLVEEYGEAALDGDVLTGVAVVRLLDFTGDGKYELYIAYADGTAPYVNRQIVEGFDRGPATLIDEEITSKSSADAEAPSIWFYEDSIGCAYIVTGEDMSKSADYNTYVQTRNGEKIYAFKTEFTKKNGEEVKGDYEKIELVNLTEEDVELVFEENEKVINSIEAQTVEK